MTTLPSDHATRSPERLHVGCGTAILDGWFNVDIQQLPGIDLTLDVTKAFPFTYVGFIFCEHFLEHLALPDGVRFLQRCHRALRPGGALRLSTPNLDWVYLTHYTPRDPDRTRKIDNTFMLNRAFYAWGHRFLYSPELLVDLLGAVGFQPVEPCRYGESRVPELRGLERHERYEHSDDLPDVIIVDAHKGDPPPDADARLDALLRHAESSFLAMLDWRLDR